MTENGKPKYFTLMEELKEKIISGRIQPGEKLPSRESVYSTIFPQPAYGAKGT